MKIEEHVIDHPFDMSQFSDISGIPIYFTQHLMMLMIAAGVAFLVVMLAARGRMAGAGRLAGAVEIFVVMIRDSIVYPALGQKYGRKYLDFFLTIAVLILTSNLLGLIPSLHIGHMVLGGTATGNFWVNIALAVMVYVYGVFCAAREHGIVAYLRSFLPHGVPLVLAPLIWFIEFAGMILKHVVLAIRLTANMMAGHLVLFGILGLVFMIFTSISSPVFQVTLSIAPVMMALAISFLEVLVALIQAGIFVILSAIFFGMAVNPHH